MSPWLFNMYMDGVVREVNVRVLGNGCEFWNGNERLRLNQLLFADDAAEEFGWVCTRRKLCVNVDKCKVLNGPRT